MVSPEMAKEGGLIAYGPPRAAGLTASVQPECDPPDRSRGLAGPKYASGWGRRAGQLKVREYPRLRMLLILREEYIRRQE
jgi:hypothetical protein